MLSSSGLTDVTKVEINNMNTSYMSENEDLDLMSQIVDDYSPLLR